MTVLHLIISIDEIAEKLTQFNVKDEWLAKFSKVHSVFHPFVSNIIT